MGGFLAIAAKCEHDLALPVHARHGPSQAAQIHLRKLPEDSHAFLALQQAVLDGHDLAATRAHEANLSICDGVLRLIAAAQRLGHGQCFQHIGRVDPADARKRVHDPGRA